MMTMMRVLGLVGFSFFLLFEHSSLCSDEFVSRRCQTEDLNRTQKILSTQFEFTCCFLSREETSPERKTRQVCLRAFFLKSSCGFILFYSCGWMLDVRVKKLVGI
jgi:hypothetical protein